MNNKAKRVIDLALLLPLLLLSGDGDYRITRQEPHKYRYWLYL